MTLMALEEIGVRENVVERQLKTTVIYSDHAAASNAMFLKQRLLRQFAPGQHIRTAWWALESLKDEVLFEASRRHAAEADLLFLALSVSGELPAEIKAWLHAVLVKNSRTQPALIALLGTTGRPAVEVNLVDSYLHEQSRFAGIDYFIYWHRQVSSPATTSLNGQSHQLHQFCPADVRERFKADGVDRWGINE